jgi:hypothetical protein
MTSKKSKIAVGGIWRNGQPYTKPIEGNETVQNNTMVNYDSPNGENLDDFMRLDALSIIILICRNH